MMKAVVLLSALVWSSCDASTPTYQGKTVQEWMNYTKAEKSSEKLEQAFQILEAMQSEDLAVISPEIKKMLQSENAQTKRDTLEFLLLLNEKNVGSEVFQFAQSFLKDPDPHVQRMALDVMEKLGNQAISAAPDILHLLKHPSSVIRVRAIYVIASLSKEALPELERLAQEDLDSDVREAAKEAAETIKKAGS